MNKILKALENKGYQVVVEEGILWSIEYKSEERIWVNGYGEEMTWQLI